MGRAGRLAGGSARRIAVDPVLVPVVFIPLGRTPLDGVRKFMLGILDLAVGGAQFLAQLHGAGGAILDAAAAGDALLLLHPGDIGAPGHVGRIEQLGGPQSVADLDVAVADGEDLSFAVDVGDLVHETVVLRFLQDGHGLIVGDVVSTSRFPEVIRHVPHADAPVAVVVGAAFVQLLAAVAAGTDAHADMAFIPLEPIGNVLDVHGLVLHGDGLFHRDDMHTDAGAAHGHHRRNLFQRKEGHPLEEHRQLRMLVHELDVHVRVFGRSGNEHRHPVDAVLPFIGRPGNGAVLGVLVPIIVLQHAEVGQLVQQGVEPLLGRGIVVQPVQFMKPVPGPVLSHLERTAWQHVQQEVQGGLPGDGVHLVLENTGQPPVFRGFGRHPDLSGDAVRDVPDQFDELGIRVLVPEMLGDELLGHFRHIVSCFSSFPLHGGASRQRRRRPRPSWRRWG